MSSYSQDTPRNTLTQKTQNNITSIVPDSVRVPFLYVKAANKAFIEAKGSRELILFYKSEMDAKDAETEGYKNATEKCKQANDTLTQKTIPLLRRESDDNAKLYADFKKAYRLQKTKTIATSITVPVVAVLSFLLGFYLHK